MTARRLADSPSPYLRQHADNPVDWWPWCSEALARARAEDKPILLSVGYSACHWCHVMAHESFEDPVIATRMNRDFVCIKVDREERPDIDAIHQKVLSLMGQTGGWPLTVFLTSAQRPFYGGTYFPPRDARGRPGFSRILETLVDLWTNRRDEVERQADAFMAGLSDLARAVEEDASTVPADRSLVAVEEVHEAARRALARFDREWGGFGRAPKFPNVPLLELLLLEISLDPTSEAGPALLLTLERMWRGGIHDHIGGGFARYSVDREWRIPHFEKMLYDNALLLGIYAMASVRWPEQSFLRGVVETTAEYLSTEMRVPTGPSAGAFWSATDADSEGVEGKYFCWTLTELVDVLGVEEGHAFASIHAVSAEGNFEHGLSVLQLPRDPEPSVQAWLASARSRLLELRRSRVPPALDDKVLTSWNALTITGLCRAADAAEGWGAPILREQWLASAQACMAVMLEVHRDQAGRTLRASHRGVAHTRGYLEDVALLAKASLDLHEQDFDPRWRDEAERLAGELLTHYARVGGGLFDTADDAETLIERPESQHDSPLPSGVAVALEVLMRIGLGPSGESARLVGAPELVEATLHRFRAAGSRPFAHASLLVAGRWQHPQATHVTVRATNPRAGAALGAAARAARRGLGHGVAIAFVVEGEGPPAAVLCRGQTCSLPLYSPTELAAALG